MPRVLVLAALTSVIGCGSHNGPRPTLSPAEQPPAETYTTETRPPDGYGESELAERGMVFDPALDCVAEAIARRAPAAPDPIEYANALPLRCGSPLYVIHAELVASENAMVDSLAQLDATHAAMAAVGTAIVGSHRAIVVAYRLVELEPITRAGAAKIRGKLRVPADKGKLLISTAKGLTVQPFDIKDGKFEVATGAPHDATLELTYTSGQVSEPFARVELGGGSPLFRRDGSLLTRINEARRVVGATPLTKRDALGTCDSVAPQVDGIDVTDRARCFDMPLIDVDQLADEIAYRPLFQDVLLTRAASLIEIAASPQPPPAVKVRVLMRFETLAPDAARARVLELLRERWPQLAERKADGLADVAATWAKDPDVFGSSATYKPALDQVAAKWTTTKTYYDGLAAARDLETGVGLLKPEQTPVAADAAVVQVRGKDGAMLNAIAVVLELP